MCFLDSAGALLPLLVAMLTVTSFADADEGMWLFNNPPKKILDANTASSRRRMAGAFAAVGVRFNDGGSGRSFRPTGWCSRTITWAAMRCKSSPRRARLHERRLPRQDQAEEIQCLDLELNVLMSIEDVTARVERGRHAGHGVGRGGRSPPGGHEHDRERIDDKTGLRSDVITLYQGGLYHLYRYKKYTDVRLVFAPEESVAFFGGDPDNFEYPRYDLDICLFRVYENGKPAKIEHFLRWSSQGMHDGELIFVAGHPGKTDRLTRWPIWSTSATWSLPVRLEWLMRREVLLRRLRASERRERAPVPGRDCSASRTPARRNVGRLAGLQDPAVMAKKRARGKAAPRRARNQAADPTQQAEGRSGGVGRSGRRGRHLAADLQRLLHAGRRQGFNCHLFRHRADAAAHGGGRRQAERRAAAASSPKRTARHWSNGSFPTAPIYDDLETVKLADGFRVLVTKLGADKRLVVKGARTANRRTTGPPN